MNSSGVAKQSSYAKMKHLDELQNFAAELETSFNSCCPTFEKPYGQVAVLACHWDNDDIGVVPLENQLLEAFRDLYGFYVESYTIPSALQIPGTLMAVATHFCDFQKKWDATDSLTIYIYSGHAAYSRTGHSFYVGGEMRSGNLTGKRMDWNILMALLADSMPKGDSLYIMDCCYAATTATHDGPEVLAAAGFDSMAGAEPEKSFTRQLIRELDQQNGAPCSIAMIYAAIHRKCRQNGLKTGPVHIPQKGKESIVLARLGSKRWKGESLEDIESKKRKWESFEERAAKIRCLETSKHRVLISVRLQADIEAPDIAQWKKWLQTHMPSGVHSSSITIESVFETGSSLIFVTLPFEIWTMLPCDEGAYEFIAFVESGNKLPQLEQPQLGPQVPPQPRPRPEQSTRSLPHRLRPAPAGDENRPPTSWSQTRGFEGSDNKRRDA